MTTRMTTAARQGRGIALASVASCFVMSAILRLILVGTALAQSAPEETASTSGRDPDPDTDVLLQAVQDRSRQLDAEEQRIAERLAVLGIAEAEFEARRVALLAAEEKLAATLSIADQAAEKDLQQLTAVYQTMKPKNAAAIFDSMDPVFAAGFLTRMAPEAAANILTGMSTQAAYAVTVIIASRNMNAPTQ